jgi:signal peptidase I
MKRVLFLAVLFALFVRSYIFTAYKVPSSSMQPTLKPGDFIFCSRLSYKWPVFFQDQSEDQVVPKRGELVVFTYASQPGIFYVKRVIGLPGDRIEIKNGRLIINGQSLTYIPLNDEKNDNPNPEIFDLYHEQYGETQWRVIFQKKTELKSFGPLIVPPGEVFLLGDNRDTSDDSRYWGAVPLTQLTGKVAIIWLSLDWQKKWAGGHFPSARWERVFITPY